MKIPSIDFVRFSRSALVISGLVILVGIGFFVGRKGLRMGIDFTGGIMVQVRTAPSVSLDRVRSVMTEAGIPAQIQNIGRPEVAEYLIKTPSQEKGNVDVIQRIEDALVAGLGAENVFLPFLQTDVVGPTMGKYLTTQALWLLFFALLCILIYVSVRFKPVYAVGGVAALFHDVAIMLTALVITGREITVLVIAAILTIIGYSINDTIVIYDRIREDVKKYRDVPFGVVVNKAVNETLDRTIITSLTTLFACLALFLLGGPVLRDFAFTLIVGVCAGTYSTIFIASSLVNEWYLRKGKKSASAS